MNITTLIKYCNNQSQRKWETTQVLFKVKRYADCLFFCHLSLEFALKAKVVRVTKEPFPLTHDLEDLARITKLSISKYTRKQLAVINTFSIAGRYDDYKLSFYKRATPQFTKKYFMITKNLLLWLEKK